MRQIFLEPAIVLVSKMVRNLKFGQTVNELRPFFEKSDKIWEKQDMPKMDHFFGTHCPKYHSWWPIGYINLDFKFHQISWPPSWWAFTTSWTQSYKFLYESERIFGACMITTGTAHNTMYGWRSKVCVESFRVSVYHN